MTEYRVSQKLTAAGQPTLAKIGEIAAADYAAIINLRPDGEAADQPDHDDAERVARKVGLKYLYIPVTVETLTNADVSAFKEAIESIDGRVYAHCGSGKRALLLHAIAEVRDGRMDVGGIIPFGENLNVDLAAAKAWVEHDRQQIPQVKGFYDEPTGSIQYVVSDPATRHCAIVDPVHDFDENSGATSTRRADQLLAFIGREGLQLQWILDTHPHADHFSAAQYLKARTGARTAIGAKIDEVQRIWRGIYNWPQFPADGSQWDQLFTDGDQFKIGNLDARVILSPGHTLASVTYLVGDAAFVHDTIFMPDSGTARADFPGGNARELWRSVTQILALPEETRLFTGHDYRPKGRHPRWEATVGEQKRLNNHLHLSEEDFVAMREKRDRELPLPKLMLPALQVNINGGRLPDPEANGTRYLKIPLDVFETPKNRT